jgi:hypothetical protein
MNEDEHGQESKALVARSQARRGDLALIPHLSSIIPSSNREAGEVREESFSPRRTRRADEG